MKILLSLASLLFLACVSNGLADSKIPSLVGKWSVKSEGAIMVRGASPGGETHWKKNQKSLVGEVTVTAQDGRVIHGTFKSATGAEPFLAVIGIDKGLYLADRDGFLDGKIINRNTIQIVYRQVTAKDTVVAVGIWTREK
jgi:hypothetical protein